jgi:hypothetical protein
MLQVTIKPTRSEFWNRLMGVKEEFFISYFEIGDIQKKLGFVKRLDLGITSRPKLPISL